MWRENCEKNKNKHLNELFYNEELFIIYSFVRNALFWWLISDYNNNRI